MAFDPWAQTNQGLSNLNNTLLSIAQMKRQDANDAQTRQLRDIQLQQGQMQLSDANAQRNALVDQFGTQGQPDPYSAAISVQNKQDQARKGFDSFLGHLKAVDSMPIPPDKKTQLTKNIATQYGIDPTIADSIQYMDSKSIKAARNFAAGELHDPTTNQPLPAGYYETEGVWTNDPANPVRLVAYKRTEGPKPTMVPEGTTVLDANGNPTYTNPKTVKREMKEIPAADGKTAQLFSIDPNNPADMVPVGKPYAVKSQVPNINVTAGGNKPPAGYRWAADGQTLEAIPGGPATKQGPGKPLTASAASDLADQAQMIKTLKEAQDLASKVNTGPIAGRVQSLGQLAGLAGDDFSKFKQKLATVNNTMLKLRSGAAVTESEYSRFLQEMPTPNDDEKVRDTKLAGAIAYMQSVLGNKLATYEESGYKIPSGVMGRSEASAAPQTSAQPRDRQQKPQGPPRTAADYLKKW